MTFTWKNILLFLLWIGLGILCFLLPIAASDFMRLRIILGLMFFVEAAFQFTTQAKKGTPLYQLVGKYKSVRDKIISGVALLMMFAVLYAYVYILFTRPYTGALRLLIAIVCVISAWAAYYGICLLFGSPDLRKSVLPKFIQRRLDSRKPGA